MPVVGEFNAVKISQELPGVAMVSGLPVETCSASMVSGLPVEACSASIVSARSLPFPCESNQIADLPTPSKMLPLAASRQLEEIKRTQYYQDRGVLFNQGERLAGVFILSRGTVKLSVTSSKGRAVILRIAQPGEMLGLASVLSGEPCIATAEALEEVEVAYVGREQFLEMLMHNPEAALSVACQACSYYEAACRQVSLLALCRSASERLAQFLLHWASSRTYRGTAPVRLRLTHEEISQVTGTTRETVTRTLIDFRKKGWASLAASHLLIQDREALEKLVA
jgi:CRP/FNR family transcriptional regulator